MKSLCLFHYIYMQSFPEVLFCNLIVFEITAMTGGNKAVCSDVVSLKARPQENLLCLEVVCAFTQQLSEMFVHVFWYAQ